MERAELAGWLVSVDAERTRATYASIAKGGWEACGCTYCRNFGAVVLKSFPSAVLAFFRQAGIDPLKDAEVYEFGESSPRVRSYGGEYYFWGRIEKDAPGELQSKPKFQVTFSSPSALVQPEFRADGAICFLFSADLPWVLEEHAT
jgi:hypothetical protein